MIYRVVKILIFISFISSCIEHKGLRQRKIYRKPKIKTDCIICPSK